MALTLRHKVNGAIIITFVLIAAVFTFILIPFQNHRFQQAVSNIGILLETLVERDNEQLANEIFDGRKKAISIRLTQMHKVKGILGISLFDARGKLLAQVGTRLRDGSAAQPDAFDPEIFADSRQAYVEAIRWHKTDSLVFSKQIDFLGERMGLIRIHYSLEGVQRDQNRALLIFAGLLGTIFFLMLIVLNWILSKAILHPITYLKDATGFIVRGNLDEPIDMDRSDEVGNLANSFEKMRDAVREKIEDLEQITGIIESTSDLVAIASRDRKLVYMNRAGRDLVGLPAEGTIEGISIEDFHPKSALNDIETIGLPAALRSGTWEGESVLLRSDGSSIPVSLVIIPQRASEDHGYVSAIMRDISGPKKVENELRFLRNYLANIIDSMPSILIGVDRKGCVLQWNRAAEKATGLSAGQVLGRSFEDVMPQLKNEIGTVNTAIRDQSVQFISKVSHQDPDGRTLYEDVTVYPLEQANTEGAVIRIDDVTENVYFEEMMIQTEKMMSVGGLAAGMAHEINNPLAGIIQNASVMSNRLDKESQLAANDKAALQAGTTMDAVHAYMEARKIPNMLEAIRESGIRIATIVNNMLSFSRKGDAAFIKHDPVEIIDQAIELASTDFDLKRHFDFKSIRIEKEYEKSLPRIGCEKSKIQQVLLNIFSNGAQAMADTSDPAFIIKLSHRQSPGMLRIEISDNGTGMDEQTRKRIFEPFFTTKSVGVGTGLGLSVSYFIITDHHKGKMDVVSTPGKGSTFVIELPLNKD